MQSHLPGGGACETVRALFVQKRRRGGNESLSNVHLSRRTTNSETNPAYRRTEDHHRAALETASALVAAGRAAFD